jgi:hypothetical protein
LHDVALTSAVTAATAPLHVMTECCDEQSRRRAIDLLINDARRAAIVQH